LSLVCTPIHPAVNAKADARTNLKARRPAWHQQACCLK